MRKARNFNVGRRVEKAVFVVAASAIFVVLGGVAAAQEGGAIPAALDAERSGKATLGVDASDLDFYSEFNAAPVGESEPIAAPTSRSETGQTARPAEVGNVEQTAPSAARSEAGQATRPAEVGNVGQTAPSTSKSEAGQAARVGEVASAPANAAEEIEFDDDFGKSNFWTQGPSGWFGPESVATSLKTILTFSILAVAPAILLATTSFVRVSVVLSLLRQGIGAGQVPSNQTIAALAVFLSLLIMTPVWSEVYEEAVVPYSAGQISNAEAFQRGQAPIRTFLWRQIEKTGNVETIGVFTQFIPGKENPEFYEDVPWRALAPAFLLSELKTAFLIGFQILIPFLIIDVVVSSVLVSTGMMMLPPTVVALPFKLALFVLSDGWTLVVKSLLESFAWSGAAG